MFDSRSCEDVEIKLKDDAFLIIISEKGVSKNSLLELDETDALLHGEENVQLLEGNYYEYELPNDYQLQEIPGIVKASRSKKNKHRGRISTGIYVGRLSLTVLSPNNEAFEVAVEVRSVKTDYRSDYRKMLEEITSECSELLMIHSSAVTQRFNINYESNSQSLYQRFAFVKSIVDSDQFRNSVLRVISMPVTAWSTQTEEVDVRRSKRIGSKQLRQIVSRRDRINIPVTHSLYSRIPSIASRLTNDVKVDCLDTLENRFVKHVLNEFLLFCQTIRYHIKNKQKNNSKLPHIYHEAKILELHFSEYLNHNIFREVSIATSLPLNSPILQRKEGYREILRVWLMYDLASKLIWSALNDDAYHAGKRDVATLYEYWVFFKLLRQIEITFEIPKTETASLIKETNDGLGLQLKSGQHIAFKGKYSYKNRNLSIKFNYNRTFRKTDYPKSGSWAQQMRPDYTLSIWPSAFTEEQAEEQELIVHVHFDAKYKVEGLEYLNINETNLPEAGHYNSLSAEKEQQKQGSYKRADILKMHAYKDAIRRTVGAYVLYPGCKSNEYRSFHEILPGLGAFPLSPSNSEYELNNLNKFIIEIIEHFCNRNSQRERFSYHKYNIHKLNGNENIHEMLPEYEPDTKIRSTPPSESTVLIGYFNQTQYNWIEESGFYNIRIDSKNGLQKYGPKELGAKYLLLHGKNELITDKLWHIISTPKLKNRSELLDLNYPTTPTCEYYLVYEIEPVNLNHWGGRKWDVRNIIGFQTGRASAIPFSTTLRALTKAVI